MMLLCLMISVGEDFESIGRRTIGLSQVKNHGRTCLEIPIINDEVAEPNEMFRLVLESNQDPSIRISLPSATIVIVDNDGSKYIPPNSELPVLVPPLYSGCGHNNRKDPPRKGQPPYKGHSSGHLSHSTGTF